MPGRTECPGGFGRRERGVVFGDCLVCVLDGAQLGGDQGLAGGDGLAVAPTVGAFGQVGAVLFDVADISFALVGCAARANMAMLAVVASRTKVNVWVSGP